MIKRIKNIPGKFYASLGAAHAGLLFAAPSHASNKLSGFFKAWEDEGKTILPILLWGFAAVGVVMMGSAAWSFIQAKKNREPVTWQVYGFFGGAFLTVIGAFALMVTASSGTSAKSLDGLQNLL